MALTYNGIPLVYGRTNHHIMGPEKDPSGTDQTLTVIKLKTTAILYVNSLSPSILLPPGELGTDLNVGQLIARIRHLLTTPRRPLYYDFLSLPGTTTGLPPSAIINLPDGVDDANGPWPDPDACSVTYTTNDCLEITWACTVKLRDCGFGTVVDGPISLRWEDQISWDEKFAATYQRVGTCIISSRSAQSIDEIRRNVIAPRVAPGFRRVRSQYTMSRDNLRCDFQFTDRQIRYAPPYPAVEMEITQSESFPLLGGMRVGEVRVIMSGVQNANVRDLAVWALTIARSRMLAANPLMSSKGTVVNGNSAPVLQSRETTEGIEIAVTMPYKAPPKKVQTQQSAAGSSFWGGIGGLLIGGPLGAIVGAGVGAMGGGQASPTQQGADPAKHPPFPWLGYGTSPTSNENPIGYATWAEPTGQINAPADGVGLAPAIALFGALLNDPCSVALASTPYAGAQTAELRTTVNLFNTGAGGGQGAPESVFDAQLVASTSAFNASQYPQLIASAAESALYEFDDEPGTYDLWQCFNEYITDGGNVVIPQTDPAGVNLEVRHSSQMVTLRKRWAATRTGAPPRVPPTTEVANWVLTREYVGLREFKVAPDGVSIQYEVKGIYEYEALNPALVNLYAEIPPFLSSATLTSLKGWFDGIGELVGTPNGALPIQNPPT